MTDIINLITTKQVAKLLSILFGGLIIYSCTPDKDMVSALENREQTATVTAMNSEILYTENGIVKLKVNAPLTKTYPNSEEPYTEFPEGITVYTYNDSMQIESNLTSKFAIYYDKKGLWTASNNVVATNRKGEVLNTEQLFWDEKKKIIYTEEHVKITTTDGVQFGKGLISDETFDNWEIKKPTSIFTIDNK
ncbi:MAG: LPS export ABC transporter periplasmic protein LptC [Tenuifilaceae bacterium]